MPNPNDTYTVLINEPQRVIITQALSEFVCNHASSSTPGINAFRDALYLEKILGNTAYPLIPNGHINALCFSINP